MVPPAEVRSYYDRPVLKGPVWKWPIPAYLFSGGLAGASSLLAAGAGRAGYRVLARRSRLTALASLTASGILLIHDLGRRDRFYNMLRVFKVTSPMSVGSWILAAYGPAAGLAALIDLTGDWPVLGAAADVAAGALGSAVATYTAVLVADTAVPAWHEARHDLPFLFASGAAASAGAVATMLAPAGEAGPARRLAVSGAVGELAMSRVMERRLGALAAPYHQGRAGELSTAAKWLSTAGAIVIAVFGRRRVLAASGGMLVAAGAACTRFAVFEAGKASARDPKYVVGPQRQRLYTKGPTSLTPG
jgi:hypothetical protein